MDLHVFPILIPPPASLSIPSLFSKNYANKVRDLAHVPGKLGLVAPALCTERNSLTLQRHLVSPRKIT